MNINLHIERLILDGFDLPHGQRPLLEAAVQAELARLLAEGGVAGELAQGEALPSMRAGHIQMRTGSDPQQLGQQIAQAVYGGIGR